MDLPQGESCVDERLVLLNIWAFAWLVTVLFNDMCVSVLLGMFQCDIWMTELCVLWSWGLALTWPFDWMHCLFGVQHCCLFQVVTWLNKLRVMFHRGTCRHVKFDWMQWMWMCAFNRGFASTWKLTEWMVCFAKLGMFARRQLTEQTYCEFVLLGTCLKLQVDLQQRVFIV